MRMTLGAMAIFALVGVGTPAAAGDSDQESHCAVKVKSGMKTEQIGNGKVDYSRCVIVVYGNGAPPALGPGMPTGRARIMAERAAKMDALRNVLEVVRGVRVQGESTADELAFQNPTVRSKVQGRIRQFKTVETKYFDDASVQITVEVPLSKVTGGLVEPKKQAVNTNGRKAYTGLVVDARGKKFRPTAYTSLKDAKGSVLYSPGHVDEAVLLAAGMNAAYVRDLKEAKNAEGVAGAPLVLKVASADNKAGVLTVAGQDADNLRQNDIDYSFLKQARVVVVID